MRVPAIVVAMIVLASCGDDDGSSGNPDSSTPTPTPPTPVPGSLRLTEFCAQTVGARCRANVRCCSEPARTYPSVEACEAILRPPCETLLSGGAFAAGAVTYDEAAATAGFATLARAADACEALDDNPVAAAVVLHGTTPEGGDCSLSLMDPSYSASCAPGLTCRLGPETPGQPRTASCIRLAGEGDRCNLGCIDGHYCDLTALVSVCREEMPAGASCRLPESCRSGACEGGACTAPTPPWCLTVR